MRLSEMKWGDLGEVYRDGEFECFGLLNYENAPGAILSFYGNKGFSEHLKNQKIKCVICTQGLVATLPQHIEGVVISENPLYAFWRMHEEYGKNKAYESPTTIGKDCRISDRAYVSQQGVQIGNHVKIEELACIKPGTIIGNNVIIRSGAVIGADCMITARNGSELFAATIYGGVMIEDNVCIGCNTTISRGSFRWLNTQIGNGTQINVNVSISHNVTIGKNGMICDGVLVSGDNHVGDEVWFSPGVLTTNSISIGDNVSLMLGTVARKNIESNCVVVGEKAYRRDVYNAIRRMPK